MHCSSSTNQPSDSQQERECGGRLQTETERGLASPPATQAPNCSGTRAGLSVASVQKKHTHPRMANAGSSWRSNGQSRRKRVLKRAVMVSAKKKKKNVHVLYRLSSNDRSNFFKYKHIYNTSNTLCYLPLGSTLPGPWIWRHWRWQQRSPSSNSSPQKTSTWPRCWTARLHHTNTHIWFHYIIETTI